jgi:hypothetical protein
MMSWPGWRWFAAWLATRASPAGLLDLVSQYSNVMEKIVQPLLIGTGMSAARYPYPKIVSAF